MSSVTIIFTYLPAHNLSEPVQDLVEMGPFIRLVVPALRHKGLKLFLTSVRLHNGTERRVFLCSDSGDYF